MFRLTLFKKQLAILLLVTVAFAGIAFFISDIAVRAMMAWSSKEDTSGGPTQGFVRLIDALTSDGKLTLEDAAERINRSSLPFRNIELRVVDSETLKAEFQIDSSVVPTDPFQAYTRHESELRPPRITVFRAKAYPSRYLVFDRPERPGAGRPGRLIRESGRQPPPSISDGPRGHGPPPIFLWTFSALIISGFLAAAISLFMLFSSMRRKARQAAEVIAAIQQGDWRKRMPIDGLDEVGNLMQEFNRMADEIESAVRAMQRSEASRTGLLQELAHDLRTPIASVRSLIETLEIRHDSLDTKTRTELFSLAQKEINYFAKLVEDLLFLAQVRDPRYMNSGKTVDLKEVLRHHCERAQLERNVAISIEPTEANLEITGDEILLSRLFRNAIDNAASFAKTNVTVAFNHVPPTKDKKAQMVITIQDDGPGFSEQALKSFGEKRFSRFVAGGDGDRLSVGLGSVIMTTVTGVHGGQIEAANIVTDGVVSGAEVRISLPSN